jgi:hypothetical protein
LFGSRSAQLATSATYHRLPAIYYNRVTAEGGLMSYARISRTLLAKPTESGNSEHLTKMAQVFE